MKQGKSLQDLAKTLNAQLQSKRDFVAPERALTVQVQREEDRQRFMMALEGQGVFDVRPTAHAQLASHLRIPKPYYDRCLTEAPELLEANVNLWLQRSSSERMVRTIDGNVRAYLSSRYRPLDNYALAEAVLPVLAEDSHLSIHSCEVTEERMYIKAVTERIAGEVQKGDVVQSGIVISNSEIGLGSVRVEPMVFRLVCLNGMVLADRGMRRHHVGRNQVGDDEHIRELLTDETKRLDDRAFWAKVQDVVRASFDQVQFNRVLDHHRVAAGIPIEGNPIQVVEVTSKEYQLSETEKNGVLTHLLTNNDLSQYGLAQAITQMSQNIDDYNRATDLERLGGVIIDLPRQDWNVLQSVG